MLLLISTHGTSCQRIIMQFRHIALQMNHLSCVCDAKKQAQVGGTGF